jgi:hypothetical protein
MKNCQICGANAPVTFPTCSLCGEASWTEVGPDTVRPIGDPTILPQLAIVEIEPLSEPNLLAMGEIEITPLPEPKKKGGRPKKDSS